MAQSGGNIALGLVELIVVNPGQGLNGVFLCRVSYSYVQYLSLHWSVSGKAENFRIWMCTCTLE